MVEVIPRYVYFYIEGGALHPDEITKLLNVKPDKTIVKGATNPRRRVSVPYPENSWSLVEVGSAKSDISELLKRLYDRVSSIRDAIKDLSGWRIGVMIVAYMSAHDPVNPGYEITPDFVSLMAELGGGFEADLYVLEQPDEEHP